MLDLNLIRKDPDYVKAGLAKRGYEADFTELLKWDEERRAILAENESIKAERNKLNKQMPALRKQGQDVAPLLEQLKGMNKLFRIRVPLIPTVNDTMENMEATAQLLEGAAMLEKVELLRYNKAAGAKYGGVGLTYAPDFPEQQEPNIFREPFERRGIRVDIL